MVSINYVLGAKERMNQAANNAQVQAANANAAGQIGAANAGTAGNVLGTIWGMPAAFGNTMGGIYGNMAGNVGSQGANYADAYGNLAAGTGSLGNNAGQNYAAYAASLGNMANMSAQERSNLYGSMAMAEAARQGTLGNLGSAALGAFGGAANSALGAYGLQQQAYNMGVGQLGAANQNALSGLGQALGQSRNAALANLGNAYAGIAGSAAQLGAAGLGASQYNNIYSSAEQTARNRQETGASGESYARDTANLFAGDTGDGSSGFQASGPGGTIASGSYGSPGGSGYTQRGGRESSSGLSQSNYGLSESEARQATTQSQQQGPQMDAFLASLASGMTGIGDSLGGVRSAQDDVRNAAQVDSLYRDAITQDYMAGLGALNNANRTGSRVPSAMLGQTLDGLLRLGGQGYNNSRRGMDQFYGSVQQPQSESDRYLNNLNAGYAAASGQLGGLAGLLAGGYQDVNRNVGSVRGDIISGADSARGDVQGLYDDSIGSYMDGNYESTGRLGGLIPRFDRTLPLQEDARKLSSLGWTYDYDTRNWISPDGRSRRSGIPLVGGDSTFAYQNV